MMPDVILLILAIISFASPVAGFAMYLFFNSGIVGFIEKLEILRGGILNITPFNVGYIVAIFALFLKNPRVKNMRRGWSAIGILMWVFTLMIFASRISALDNLYWKEIAFQILSCLIWAPLFSAFLKLDLDQWDKLKDQIIFLAAITAFLNVVIIVTKNRFLYQTLFIGRNIGGVRVPIDYVVSRVTLPGLWTLVPLGFWIAAEKIFSQQRQSHVKIFLYRITIGIILIAILFNLGRGTLLGVICGAIFVIVMFLFFKRGHVVKLRLIISIALLVIVTLIMMYSFEKLHNQWIERVNSLLSAEEDPTVNARLKCNEYMLKKLFRDMPLLGYHNQWSYDPRMGDPHCFVTMWWNNGLIASLLYIVIMFFVFLKLANIIVLKQNYPAEIINQAVFLMAYYFQYQFSMASGDYLTPDYIFPAIFLIASVDRISRWQK